MKFILALALSIGAAQAHGGVYNYTIDGVDYAGHYPWLPEEGQASIQRRWWPDPIYNLSHPYLACNRGNPLPKSNPTLHAPIRAGGVVTAHYLAPECPAGVVPPREPSVPGYGDPVKPMRCTGPEYPWPHYMGPVYGVYLADCQGPCDQWDGSGKRWFKIFESAYNSTGWPERGGPFEETDISYGQNWLQSYLAHQGVNATIPVNLKPGHYLIRNEIFMIESSTQFYPQCAQLEVTGEGDAVPGEEYLVEFPGAYKETDPGVWIAPYVYHRDIGHKTFNYTTPGPKVWPEASQE